MSIYLQDESSFEISHKIWRVLVPAWEKALRTNGKERRHDCLSVSWVRSLEGKLIYNSSKTKTWKDFLALIYKLRSLIKKKRIILIVDNASIHRAKKLKKYCEEHNIILVYLPPYSPDLNPIELLRRMLKKEFRKIQWIYDDIKKSVLLSTKKLKNRISEISINSLLDISYI